MQSVCASSEVALEPWRSCSLLASALAQIVVITEVSITHLSLDVLRWTLYRTPVGSLGNAVLCCALLTKPYHSNDGAVLLRVCVAMGMLLHSNEHLQISTVADRLSMLWEDSMEGSHTGFPVKGFVVFLSPSSKYKDGTSIGPLLPPSKFIIYRSSYHSVQFACL
jgi:hypothetical protein